MSTVASRTDPLADPLGLAIPPDDAPALWVEGDAIVYGELRSRVTAMTEQVRRGPSGVVAIGMAPSVDSIVSYLAAVAAGRPVVLVDVDPPSSLVDVLTERYGVSLWRNVRPRGPDHEWVVPEASLRRDSAAPGVVLLTTSGSTGSPKLVRLSHRAIRANASAIASSLGIGPDERAPTSLPLFYSYGLSVLNSHLFAGASVVLTSDGVMSREFWTTVDGAACTSFAGVPYTYAMLKRLRFDPAAHPHLRTLTQAGGKLELDLRQHFHRAMSAAGGRFVVMYGQTEATARLSVLPHDEFVGRERSVGRAIPGGRFAIVTDDGETDRPDVEGEVVYYGDNVMDGYAETADDLEADDQLRGRLLTGDRGHLDADGVLWLSGRVKRITKVFGTRVNLDDVEEMIAAAGLTGAAVSGDDVVAIAVEGELDPASVSKEIAERLRVHRSGVRVHRVDRLPLLPNGKIDYRTLEASIHPETDPR